MSQIIRDLWAQPGRYFIATQPPGGRFAARAFDDVDTALSYALSMSSCDVWFGCSVYRPDATRRTRENVASVQGFWLDLDVKPGVYDSQADALRALGAWLKSTRLPKPTIVSSGRGIHVYWATTEPMAVDVWQMAAERLKTACALGGLQADAACTADAARVMRVPGTTNHKEPPTQSRVLAYSPPVAMDAFLSRLPVTRRPEVQATVPYTGPTLPVSAARMADRCAQIAAMRDSGGNIAEPLWYACIGALCYAEDGDAVIHQWSSGYPRYTPEETDRKIAQYRARASGPTTCERFQTLNPGGCAGCPNLGKITSPVHLGRYVEPSEQPASAPATTLLSRIGTQWVVSDGAVWMIDDDGTPNRVLGVELYVERVGLSSGANALGIIRWRTPQGTWKADEMPLAVAGKADKLTEWLLDHAITDFNEARHIMKYIRDTASELNRLGDPERIARKFGWTDEGTFILGEKEIGAEGVKTIRLSPRVPKVMRDNLHASGNLDAWSKATEIFQNPDYWPHAFTLLAALATPILRLSSVDGSVLSLAGDSGSGKTTAMEFAMSAYGRPAALIQSPQGTMIAKGELMRAAQNLPVGIDDINSRHTTRGGQISELVYMAANGRAKERSTQDGGVRDQEEWSLLLILTTNSPLHDLPERFLGEAERRRVLELPVVQPLSRIDASMLHEVLQNHYGLAAPHLVSAFARSPKQVAQLHHAISAKIIDMPGVPESNRFGAWLVAAAMLAGRTAVERGIIRFDPGPVIKQAIKALKEQAILITDPLTQYDEAFRAWVNEHQHAFTRRQAVNLKSWIEDGSSIRDVKGLFLVDDGILWVPVRWLKQIAIDNHIPTNVVKRWKEEAGCVDTKVVRLARNGAAERCAGIPYGLLADETLDTDSKGGTYD